ncbi:DUF1028 domain-containing protein [Sphaerobacter thermophilus]|jgi:uncharacterized Ntn-hydrolase superfamily protein|uniref:DUF1028 domain-containing protein n=1 Tax=Sphaerobacter thermophilus TaxID=2057 RepID=UPI000DB2702F|nr:MAG: fimbrial assembly protein FimA [Sphaerobacter thermophilus]
MTSGRQWPPVSTFSIVAYDRATGDLGIAVQSKFLAVGAVVPWARAGVGAVATQAWCDTSHGPRGLDLMAGGASAGEALAAIIGTGEGHERRQVGMVDARGRAASYTGPEAPAWAGSIVGDGFCCQGNILAGPQVVRAMANAYQSTTGSFANRLLAALEAGQAAGGDSRGQQSAAILVVREKGGFLGGNDRYIDLRVDDHPRPIEELRRLVMLHRVYFQTDEADLVVPDEALIATIRRQLVATGDLPDGTDDPAAITAALERFASRENLESRLRDDGQIDTVILEFLRKAAGDA